MRPEGLNKKLEFQNCTVRRHHQFAIYSATKSWGLGHGLGLPNTQAQAVSRPKPETRPSKAWLAVAWL